MSYGTEQSPRDARWQSEARAIAPRILRRKEFRQPWPAERLTLAVVKEIGHPADLRSMGWVIRDLADAGRIRRVGIGRATVLRHHAMSPLWEAS